jgi:hypothetical protein
MTATLCGSLEGPVQGSTMYDNLQPASPNGFIYVCDSILECVHDLQFPVHLVQFVLLEGVPYWYSVLTPGHIHIFSRGHD